MTASSREYPSAGVGSRSICGFGCARGIGLHDNSGLVRLTDHGHWRNPAVGIPRHTFGRSQNGQCAILRDPQILNEATALERSGVDVIHLELGRPDFDTPGHIKQAAIDALTQGMVHYTSNYGIPELREAIARKLFADNSVRLRSRT